MSAFKSRARAGLRSSLALVLISGILSLTSGCASQPVPYAESVAIPPERIFDPSYLKPEPGFGEVIVIRDNGTLVGSGISIYLSVDGHHVADLDPTNRCEIWMKPGEHILSITDWATKLDGIASLAVIADPQAVKHVRLGTSGAGMTIQQSLAPN